MKLTDGEVLIKKATEIKELAELIKDQTTTTHNRIQEVLEGTGDFKSKLEALEILKKELLNLLNNPKAKSNII